MNLERTVAITLGKTLSSFSYQKWSELDGYVWDPYMAVACSLKGVTMSKHVADHRNPNPDPKQLKALREYLASAETSRIRLHIDPDPSTSSPEAFTRPWHRVSHMPKQRAWPDSQYGLDARYADLVYAIEPDRFVAASTSFTGPKPKTYVTRYVIGLIKHDKCVAIIAPMAVRKPVSK